MIDLPIARSISQLFVNAANDNVTEIHLLLQSPGGAVNEGVFLYDFIKSFPVDVLAYNCGHVGSAAVSAYLGAKKRFVSPNGTFLVHRTYPAAGNVGAVPKMQSIVSALKIEDARTESILRGSVNMTDAQWAIFEHNDLTIDAEAAIRTGFAHEMSSFSPAGPMYVV